ncbi:MAG: signal peptidase I [Candidatus Thermoplasmatota archaeon]|nr:signal peptidase I [Candidatus Thermoplasmatota archaeon]
MRIRSLLPPAYIAVWQISFYFRVDALYIAILLLPFSIPFQRSFLNDRKWYLGSIFMLLLILLLILPAAMSRSLSVSVSLLPLLNSILYSILFTVSAVSVIFAGIMEATRKNQATGMILTGIAYFLALTPIFQSYTITEIVKILLYNFSFDVVLSFYLSFLYLADDRKTLGVLAFILPYSVFSFINVTEKVSPLFNIVWEVISVSITFWITHILIGKSIWVRKLLRGKKRLKLKRRTKPSDIAFAAIMGVMAIGAIGGYYTHTISADPTSSMYPIINPGSLLLIKPAEPQSISVGTIIEFHAPWANGTLFAHEVVRIYERNGTIYFATRGVNNPVNDPDLVPGSDLVGIVEYHIPYLGYPVIYGRLTAAFLIVLVMTSFFVPGNRRRA